jgi:hypothetical protein
MEDTDMCVRAQGERHYDEMQIQARIQCPTGLRRHRF